MADGGNVVTEGLGTTTVVTEGFGYTLRAVPGAVRPDIVAKMDIIALLKVRNALGNAFASLRGEFGEEATIEAIWAAVDNTILSQPGIFERPNLEGIAPGTLAKMAYKGVK